jgi:hypothetical protein
MQAHGQHHSQAEDVRVRTRHSMPHLRWKIASQDAREPIHNKKFDAEVAETRSSRYAYLGRNEANQDQHNHRHRVASEVFLYAPRR